MNNYRKVYPVILTTSKDGVAVSMPDLSLETQGEDIVKAI